MLGLQGSAYASDYGAFVVWADHCGRRSVNREEPAQFAVLREVAREHPRGGNGSGDLAFTHLHVPEREHGFGLYEEVVPTM
jgi:hypothetical protein